MFSFLSTCRRLPFPQSRRSHHAWVCTVRQERTEAAQWRQGNTQTYFPSAPLDRECMCIPGMMQSHCLCPLLCISDCKHRWLQKPERPFNKVIFKTIFLCARKAMAQFHWQMAPEFALRVQKKPRRGWGEAAERVCPPGWVKYQATPSCCSHVEMTRAGQSCNFPREEEIEIFVQISQFLKAGNYLKSFNLIRWTKLFGRQIWCMGYHFAATPLHPADFLVLTYDTKRGSKYLLTEWKSNNKVIWSYKYTSPLPHVLYAT